MIKLSCDYLAKLGIFYDNGEKMEGMMKEPQGGE
jgi:hypothetical protein